MADTGWVAFGSGIAGDLVGGAAAAAVAYVAGGSERRHSAKAKIYLEEPPAYEQEQDPATASRMIDEIVRTADICGPSPHS
jgi:hypothetical protein